MMGGSRGSHRVRHQQPDSGGDGDGRGRVRVVGPPDLVEAVLSPGGGGDGLSIEERRAGALMARDNEPQGSRRLILDLAFISGQPISDIERLRLTEVPYVTDLVVKVLKVRRG